MNGYCNVLQADKRSSLIKLISSNFFQDSFSGIVPPRFVFYTCLRARTSIEVKTIPVLVSRT